MGKRITLVLELEDEDYEDFINQDEVNDDLHNWFFAELCQNHGLGFLTECSVEYIDD